MAEIDDRLCWWWSCGLGSMTVERGVRSHDPDVWFLWRRQKTGERIFCGSFRNEDDVMAMAHLLARVHDTEFVAAIRQLIADKERTAA